MGVKTPAQFHYSKAQWYDDQPDVTYGDGDGTVNKRSLYGCLKWKGNQRQKIYHQEFKGVDHMSILGSQDILNYIEKVVKNQLWVFQETELECFIYYTILPSNDRCWVISLNKCKYPW